MKEALKLALEALELCNGSATVEGVVIYTDLEIAAIKEALAQPEQEPVECDCNQGQSCHVCDPYFPFDSAPQTTRLTQKTTTNDVAIGVDVTEDGTHVTAMRMRPDGINIVIYSQFHPLAQPEQEPVAWPCVIETADFEEDTVTLKMQSKDYSVGVGLHWLSTTPPQRTWVGMTDEETAELVHRYAFYELTRQIEAKLKEKNT